MNIVFFEDPIYRNFDPLSLSHPVYTLLLGTSRLYEKWVKALAPKKYSFFCRQYLGAVLSLETGREVNVIPAEDTIYLNARILPDTKSVASVRRLGVGEALVTGDSLLGFRPAAAWADSHRDILQNLHDASGYENARSGFEESKVAAQEIRYLWEMIRTNGEIIEREFKLFDLKGKSSGKIDRRASIIKKSGVAILARAIIGPQAVIDASGGPVIVGNGAVIEPLTYIKGPSYIGADCRVVSGRVREGCSLGPVCRVGGEIEETIMLGYCNKYHEGFLGHSYIGEWVNLGAMTTNSDLKNNYAKIKVAVGENMVDTEEIKVGCFIGDHTKTGIGTLLNTGTSIGFSCNLYGGGLFEEKSIRSFSWGTPGKLVEYKLEKALQTASASMRRRDIAFGPAYEKVFSELHAQAREMGKSMASETEPGQL